MWQTLVANMENVRAMVWKQWIRDLVMREAKQRLATQAMDTVTDASTESLALDATVDVAVVVNESAEAGSILDRMTSVFKIHSQEFRLYRGSLEGRRVILAQVGGDSKLAARVTQSVIGAHQPQWVIAAGFSVGLQPRLKQQDLFIASRIIDVHGAGLKIDVDDSAAKNNAFQLGTVLTVDHLPVDENRRRMLGDTHQADVADTTSLGIAEACRDAGVCCLVIRIVRDHLEDATPNEIQHSTRQTSFSAKIGSLVGGTLRRPGTARDWFRHKQDALRSADCLADFLKMVICRWLPLRPPAESVQTQTPPEESARGKDSEP